MMKAYLLLVCIVMVEAASDPPKEISCVKEDNAMSAMRAGLSACGAGKEQYDEPDCPCSDIEICCIPKKGAGQSGPAQLTSNTAALRHKPTTVGPAECTFACTYNEFDLSKLCVQPLVTVPGKSFFSDCSWDDGNKKRQLEMIRSAIERRTEDLLGPEWRKRQEFALMVSCNTDVGQYECKPRPTVHYQDALPSEMVRDGSLAREIIALTEMDDYPERFMKIIYHTMSLHSAQETAKLVETMPAADKKRWITTRCSFSNDVVSAILGGNIKKCRPAGDLFDRSGEELRRLVTKEGVVTKFEGVTPNVPVADIYKRVVRELNGRQRFEEHPDHVASMIGAGNGKVRILQSWINRFPLELTGEIELSKLKQLFQGEALAVKEIFKDETGKIPWTRFELCVTEVDDASKIRHRLDCLKGPLSEVSVKCFD